MFARPEYRWVTTRNPLDWLLGLWHRLLALFDGLGRAHPATFRLLMAGLALLLAGLLVHLGYVVWRITRPTVRTEPADAPGAGAERQDARAHLARAEELARLGRYPEALAHRFLAVVLELDALRALTFHPAKTPAEYVAEARLDTAGRASLAELVGRLYRHLFGAVPCDGDAYRAFGAAAEVVPLHVAPH